MDLRILIRIRVHTKMSRIRNTVRKAGPDVGPLVGKGVQEVPAHNEEGGPGLHPVEEGDGLAAQVQLTLPSHIRVLLPVLHTTINIKYHPRCRIFSWTIFK